MINVDLPIEQYTDGVRKIIETQTTDIGLFRKTIRDDFITVQDLNDALIILEPYEKTLTKINCINNEILRRSGNGSAIEIPDYMEPKRDISTIYDLSEKARYAAQASMNNYLHPSISTHASRMGCDFSVCSLNFMSQFLLTHPAWDATMEFWHA